MNTTPKTRLVLLTDAADELHKLADRLTDAAEELLPDPQPAANANCPTCSLPFRETVGMVCQTCGTDYAPESTPAQPDEVGWVRMPFEVDICGDIIPADDLITYARRLRTNLSEAERSLKDLATTKVAPRPPQPAPVALPTVEPEHLKAGDHFRAIYEYRVDHRGDWQPVAPNRYELVCHDDDPAVAVVRDWLDSGGEADAHDLLARIDAARADA